MEFMEELHQYECEALKAFVELCDKHGLNYFVIGGTLLGAVRHHGFIPWDDDVDVAMPRKDYDKLLMLAKELPHPFVIEDYHFTKDFKSYFAKIRNTEIEVLEELTDNTSDKRVGYLIDILPIDGTPNDTLARKLYYAKILGYRFLCGAANVHTGIRTSRPKKEQMILQVCRFLRVYRFLKIKKIYQWMDRAFHAQDMEHSMYAGTITGAYKTKEIVRTSYFGVKKQKVLLPFESLEVRVPYHYREYLTHMFGNYMQLPPVEARKIHYQGAIRHVTARDGEVKE